MEAADINTLSKSQPQVLAANKLIRNTYALLALTLLFSALTAGLSMALNLPSFGPLISLAGYFALLFLTVRFRNSSAGVFLVFALTGFMGATLGPILSYTIGLPNGGLLVMQAMGGTAVIFFALSAYVFKSRKDFSFIGGFLFAGMIVLLVAMLAAIIFQLPALSLAVSAGFMLLASGLILYETSNIIHGGETNYVMATVSLYVSIYNLFVSLLHLLLAFSGNDD
jgi:modulator of FtsH protease